MNWLLNEAATIFFTIFMFKTNVEVEIKEWTFDHYAINILLFSHIKFKEEKFFDMLVVFYGHGGKWF